MNRSKDKGTWAETRVAYYLQCNGFPAAERRALHGSVDLGDITGTPGVCWEVKYTGSDIQMKHWMAELRAEMANCKTDVGLLIIKPPRRGERTCSSWYASMTPATHDKLWTLAAGNGLRAVPVATGIVHPQSAKSLLRLEESPWPLNHVATYPPGFRARTELHNRVMFFGGAVTLLRAAGFGEPLTIEELHGGQGEVSDLQVQP